MDVVVDPLIEEILAFVADAVGGGFGEVTEPVCPAGFEGVGDGEFVDEFVALGGVRGGDEFLKVEGATDAAGKVEMEAAKELFVGGEGCVGDVVALNGTEDVFVDEIATNNRAGGGGGIATDGGRWGGELLARAGVREAGVAVGSLLG